MRFSIVAAPVYIPSTVQESSFLSLDFFYYYPYTFKRVHHIKFVLNIHVVKSIQPIPMELPLRLCSHTSRLILFIPAWPHEDPIGVPRTSLCRSPGAVSEGGEVQEARVALHPYRQVPWMPGCQRTSKGLPVPSACPPCLTCKGCGKTHSVTVKGCTLPG